MQGVRTGLTLEGTGEHGNAPGPWGRQGALRAQPYTEPVRRSLVTLVTRPRSQAKL